MVGTQVGDPVPRGHSQRAQGVGEAQDPPVQLAVGPGAALVDEGDPVGGLWALRAGQEPMPWFNTSGSFSR